MNIMLALKIFFLGVCFVLTGGGFFSKYFKKNKFLVFLSFIIAFFGGGLLILDIYGTITLELKEKVNIANEDASGDNKNYEKEKVIYFFEDVNRAVDESRRYIKYNKNIHDIILNELVLLHKNNKISKSQKFNLTAEIYRIKRLLPSRNIKAIELPYKIPVKENKYKEILYGMKLRELIDEFGTTRLSKSNFDTKKSYSKKCWEKIKIREIVLARLHLLEVKRYRKNLEKISGNKILNIASLFSYMKTKKMEALSIYDKFGFDYFVPELLDYHKKIIETRDWQIRFDIIVKEDGGIGKSSVFQARGFPKASDACLNVRSVTSFSIDSYLYSFWLRRYLDGTFEASYEILEWMNNNLKPFKKNKFTSTWGSSQFDLGDNFSELSGYEGYEDENVW